MECVTWECRVQVVLVLTLELLVLPAAHGFFIDVCMLPFLGGTIQGRLRLFAFSPITWIVVHWAIGMVFLMSVGSLLSLSRRLLRPGTAFCTFPLSPTRLFLPSFGSNASITPLKSLIVLILNPETPWSCLCGRCLPALIEVLRLL